MAKIISGHFEPDGGLIYLPIGFVPDYFWLLELGVTNPIQYFWMERMEDDESSGSKEGVKLAGNGTQTKLSDAGGIAAYNAGSQLPTITQWSGSQAVTARTATAHGTYYKPTVNGLDMEGNKADRDQIFESVTAGTTGGTEPVWPVEIGQNSASDNGVIWQKVANVALFRGGYQGVRIAAALMTNGQEMYYKAEQHNNSEDHGDVDGWTGGIYGA